MLYRFFDFWFFNPEPVGLKQKKSKTYESGAPPQTLSLRRVLERVSPGVSIPTPAGVDLVQQVDYALAAVPSLIAFLVFNTILKFVMRDVLGITKFPAPLVGMFLFFFAMAGMKEESSTKFVDFFEPGVTLLTNFLPALFAPGLIRTPAALALGGVQAMDFLKFLLIISLGSTTICIQTGLFTDFIMRLKKTHSSSPPAAASSSTTKPQAKGPFKPWFSQHVELIF